MQQKDTQSLTIWTSQQMITGTIVSFMEERKTKSLKKIRDLAGNRTQDLPITSQALIPLSLLIEWYSCLHLCLISIQHSTASMVPVAQWLRVSDYISESPWFKSKPNPRYFPKSSPSRS